MIYKNISVKIIIEIDFLLYRDLSSANKLRTDLEIALKLNLYLHVSKLLKSILECN